VFSWLSQEEKGNLEREQGVLFNGEPRRAGKLQKPFVAQRSPNASPVNGGGHVQKAKDQRPKSNGGNGGC